MTFDDIAERRHGVVRDITITGTRSISDEDGDRLQSLFRDYLLPFATAHFYIGGAAGVDTATLDWLAEHTSATLTVVVPCTVADQSHAIRARAHAVHAEVQARAGNSTNAAIALDRARKTIEQLSVGDPFAAFNADRVSGFEGLCALYSGQAHRADDLLTRSLSGLTGARDAVQRGIGATDLALARLRLGDAEACVTLLHEAVDITATTGGRVPAQRVGRTRRHLRLWRDEPFVAELDDHIHDTLLGR
jgi:hypothetical protein